MDTPSTQLTLRIKDLGIKDTLHIWTVISFLSLLFYLFLTLSPLLTSVVVLKRTIHHNEKINHQNQDWRSDEAKMKERGGRQRDDDEFVVHLIWVWFFRILYLRLLGYVRWWLWVWFGFSFLLQIWMCLRNFYYYRQSISTFAHERRPPWLASPPLTLYYFLHCHHPHLDSTNYLQAKPKQQGF